MPAPRRSALRAGISAREFVAGLRRALAAHSGENHERTTVHQQPPVGHDERRARAWPRCCASPRPGRCSAWAGSSCCRSTTRWPSSACSHFLINDERCGAFAADAYARVTNRPGICDGTLGPGATNLVTGLIEALNAGTPIVAFAGDTNRAHSWKNMTQECRQVEILRPAVKELIRVEQTSRIPELLRRAFAVATSGRPGPVLLDVPEDVCHGEHDFAAEDFVDRPDDACSAPARRIRPDRADIERAAALIAKAKRPLILAGGGIHLSRGLRARCSRFAEAQSIPVAHTMSGKGGIACTHPLSAGLFGRYSRIANELIEASDCLLVVGCKLGEIATKRYALPPRPHPAHSSRHRRRGDRPLHPGRGGAVGRCAGRARRLCRGARRDSARSARAARADYVAEIPKRMAAWRDDAAAAARFARAAGAYGAALPRAEPGPAGGQHPRRRWRVCRALDRAALRHQKSPGGISSPIAASPRSAMGCRAASAPRSRRPTGPVVAISGDGGFNMMLGELETARRAGCGLTIDRRQQRRLRLCQGVAARDDGRALPILRPRRDGLRGDRPRDGLRRHPRRGPRGAACGARARAWPNATARRCIDVVVTRDPAHMLPAVDNRTVEIKHGDRVA